MKDGSLGADADEATQVMEEMEFRDTVAASSLAEPAPSTTPPTWSQSVIRSPSFLPSTKLFLPPPAVDPYTGLSVQCAFNPLCWLLCLADYPDQQEAQVILNGMRRGVDIRFSVSGNRGGPRSVKNLQMPIARRQDAEEFIEAELMNDVKAGRRAGPFETAPFPEYRVSPFGIVEKKGSSKLRLIHHLSWPRDSSSGTSVNANIEALHCPLASFDDAVAMLNDIGDLSDVWMFKVDVKSAYRCIPVRPEDWPLLGGMWKGLLFFDMSLPFGMRSSCGCWECYSTAAEWITKRIVKLQKRLTHYIDDYFGAVRGKAVAKRKLRQMLELFQLLGIPVSDDKVEGPSQQLTFLGILIDVKAREIRLDSVKLNQARELMHAWEKKEWCTRKELQSLAGWLFWATKVVRGGRTFLHRIVDAIRMRKHDRPQRVEASVREDLKWWNRFLDGFNGISMIPESKWTEHHSDGWQLFTDASGYGYGARWGNNYLSGKWSDEQLERVRGDEALIIAVLELCGIVIAALSWGNQWQGKRIVVRCDNTAAVAAINSGYCKQPLMMELVRELWYWSCTHSFQLRSVHVPGVLNVDADDLSRGHVEQMLIRNPSIHSSPTTPRLPNCLN